MPFTTSPRPLDVAALWPELVELARTAVRLHPRPGEPAGDKSSIGGPLLWPENEPWPTCTEEHESEIDTIVADSAEARRDDGEVETPMIPLAQLFASEVPGLPFAGTTDLLQVLWCPWDHPATQTWRPKIEIRWRSSADPQLRSQQAPMNTSRDKRYVPRPCVLSPEPITRLSWRATRTCSGTGPARSLRDGRPADGCAGPWPTPCTSRASGAEGKPLLTIPSDEWD